MQLLSFLVAFDRFETLLRTFRNFQNFQNFEGGQFSRGGVENCPRQLSMGLRIVPDDNAQGVTGNLLFGLFDKRRF